MRSHWYRAAVITGVFVTSSLILAGSALAVSITNYSPTTTLIPEVSGACVGSMVQINGSGFVNDGGPVTVQFNGAPAVDVTIGSDSVIYAKMPAAATAGSITVTTAKGTATAATAYTVFPCAATSGPTILALGTTSSTGSSGAAKAAVSSFSPAKAKAGATVTIKGSGFTGATAVKFGGVAATSFKVVSATKITATVPAKAKSGKVSVTTAAGASTSTGSFVKL